MGLIPRLTLRSYQTLLVAVLLAASGVVLPLRAPAYALPPAGTDVLDVVGQVSVVSRLGTETISLAGTITIVRGNPQLDGGVEVVSAEIVSLSLAGESVTGPVTVSESPTFASTGEIRSLQPPPDQFPASSFFDVFIEVAVPASPSPTVTLHNEAPLHIVPMSGGSEVSLSRWPPSGVTYRVEPSPCVPLLPSAPKEICVTSLSFTLDPPVGGIAAPPEPAGTSLETGGMSGVLVGIAAGVAGVLALSGAAWWTKSRRLR